jgi:tRNA(Arg) A34 adenosine deaminase TadA
MIVTETEDDNTTITMISPEEEGQHDDRRSAGVVVVTASPPRTSPKLSAAQIKTLLTVIATNILPLTRAKVATGCKMFGAAILDDHLRLVHADTNDETTCALFHGEVKCIYAWSRTVATASERRDQARTAVFLSTHEPCCMCISSILWCGFHTVYYLFSYETTAAQGIPYDIETMHELWGVNTYRKHNKYLTSVCLLDCIAALDDNDDDDMAANKTELQQMAADLMAEYDQVSQAQDVTSAVS